MNLLTIELLEERERERDDDNDIYCYWLYRIVSYRIVSYFVCRATVGIIFLVVSYAIYYVVND